MWKVIGKSIGLVIGALILSTWLYGASEINTPMTPVKPAYTNSGKPVLVVTHVYEDLTELRLAFVRINGSSEKATEVALRLQAWSVQYELTDGTKVCEMAVLRPVVYDDPVWVSWGHEMGHCVYGQWHNNDLK